MKSFLSKKGLSKGRAPLSAERTLLCWPHYRGKAVGKADCPFLEEGEVSEGKL